MAFGTPREYLPVIGFAMLERILDLVEAMEKQTTTVGFPNEVQTSPWEYGYCTTIIVLAVMVLESAVNRARYIRNETETRRPDTVVSFEKIVQDSDLSSSVEELFVIRDLIAHNHIWNAEVINDDAGPLRFTKPPTLMPWYGDNKYRRHVDMITRVTKKLKLNAFPTRIWREDALKVLNVLDSALSALDRVDSRYFGVSTQPVMFHGEYLSFSEAVARMRTTKLGILNRQSRPRVKG